MQPFIFISLILPASYFRSSSFLGYILLELLISSWNISISRIVSWVKNITIVHNLLGFVMSILLVFRTNTAYDRWWEARKQWGTLTNTSRMLAIKMNALLKPDDKVNRSFYKKAIPLFADTLFDHLRSNKTRFMLDEIEHPEFETSMCRNMAPIR
jgi:putative membrane protein